VILNNPYFPPELKRLIQSLGQLPGIGPKTARRLAFYIMEMPVEQSRVLAQTIENVKEKLKPCPLCAFPVETNQCPFCSNHRRHPEQICIVEKAQDIINIENTGIYQGHYHSLGGLISPLDGIDLASLRYRELLLRLEQNHFQEAIIALNPTTEGEATSLTLSMELKQRGLRTMRISLGLPMGTEIEFADALTLSRALSGRVEL